MALTKAQIRDRAAEELGILPIGQTLQAQDDARITQAYNEVYADLKGEGLATWASTASVPDECVPHVVMLVAHSLVGAYSVSQDRMNRILLKAGADGDRAKRELRRVVQNHHVSATGPRDY